MAELANYTGRTFSRLTGVAFARRTAGRTYWTWHCECGESKEIDLGSVRAGRVRSCGCLHKERCAAGLNRLQHGGARKGQVARLHNIWRGMLKRCNPNRAKPDPKYAGRGITVCDEWGAYAPFRNWALSHGYCEDLTIERIDNDGNYEPANCCWIAPAAQALNRRTSRKNRHA